MDFNKISEQHILHIVMAVAALTIAVAARFICVKSDCDTGTANLVFIIVLGVEVILYLILMKVIIFQFEKLVAWRKNKKEAKEIVVESIKIIREESVHDQIVRERFEESITLFQEYTQKSFGRYISPDEIKKLNGYIELFAKEQPLANITPVQTPKHQINNNDLYHFGWNMWNHFKNYRQDQTQECVVAWLKVAFTNLNDVELSTIKGKLTIFDAKSKITIQKSISDYLRFLKE